MKANAPERIYLFKNPITETPDDRWLSKRSGDTDVEYIRKDVFVEKAINWLRKELINFEEPVDTEKTFINDFKKAMEE